MWLAERWPESAIPSALTFINQQSLRRMGGSPWKGGPALRPLARGTGRAHGEGPENSDECLAEVGTDPDAEGAWERRLRACSVGSNAVMSFFFFFFCNRECGFQVSLAWEIYRRDVMGACLRWGAGAGREPLLALTH